MASMYARTLARAAGFDLRARSTATVLPVAIFRPLSTAGVPPASQLTGTFEVSVDRCASYLGWGFSDRELNPLVQTLQQYMADESLQYVDSALYRLHADFQPNSLDELFFWNDSVKGSHLDDWPVDRRLYRYIWDIRPKGLQCALKERSFTPNYHFGPLPEPRRTSEFERLVSVFESIRKNGFLYDGYPSVTGYFVADRHDYRFIIGSGNHRVAALKVLGVDTVHVRLHSHPAVVNYEQLHLWSPVFGDHTSERLFRVFLGRESYWPKLV